MNLHREGKKGDSGEYIIPSSFHQFSYNFETIYNPLRGVSTPYRFSSLVKYGTSYAVVLHVVVDDGELSELVLALQETAGGGGGKKFYEIEPPAGAITFTRSIHLIFL